MRAFVFTDKALERQAGRFVWLSINTEMRASAAVLAKYPVEAWPSFYVIDPASEKVVLRYVGGATVPQLQRILDDGERVANAAGGMHKPDETDETLGKADRFFAGGKNAEAAEAPPPPDPRPAVARETFPTLRFSPSAANVAGSGLDCAVSLPKDAPPKAALVQALAADTREVLTGKRVGPAAADVSALYQTLVGEGEG